MEPVPLIFMEHDKYLGAPITSFWSAPLEHVYYITISDPCQEVFKNFFRDFRSPFVRVLFPQEHL